MYQCLAYLYKYINVSSLHYINNKLMTSDISYGILCMRSMTVRERGSTDLGLCACHQVFELHDLVVDGGAVALLDGVVRRALLTLVRLATGLAADSDAVDGQFLRVHDDWHCSEDGTPTH